MITVTTPGSPRSWTSSSRTTSYTAQPKGRTRWQAGTPRTPDPLHAVPSGVGEDRPPYRTHLHRQGRGHQEEQDNAPPFQAGPGPSIPRREGHRPHDRLRQRAGLPGHQDNGPRATARPAVNQNSTGASTGASVPTRHAVEQRHPRTAYPETWNPSARNVPRPFAGTDQI